MIDGVSRDYNYTNTDSPYPRHDAASLGTHSDWYTRRGRSYVYNDLTFVSILLESLSGDASLRSDKTPENTAEGEPRFVSDRMLYPLESDGRAWYLIVAS